LLYLRNEIMAWKAAKEDLPALREFIRTFDWEGRKFYWGKNKPIAGTGRSATPKKTQAKLASPILDVRVEYVKFPENHRTIDDLTVAGLAESIQLLGLQHPIIVQRISEFVCELVAGAHRLSAVKMLGWERIQVRVVDSETAELLNISENMHRSELSQLERSEHIIKWIELRRGGRPSQPLRGGRQPNDLGNSEVARELGVDRRRIRQARRHSNIHASVRKILRAKKLDTLEKLDELSELNSEAEQLNSVMKGFEEREADNDQDSAASETRSYEELVSLWAGSSIEHAYGCASLESRTKFIKNQLRHNCTSRARWAKRASVRAKAKG
jgi:hypothetical protein